jgi:hypothetical protein
MPELHTLPLLAPDGRSVEPSEVEAEMNAYIEAFRRDVGGCRKGSKGVDGPMGAFFCAEDDYEEEAIVRPLEQTVARTETDGERKVERERGMDA